MIRRGQIWWTDFAEPRGSEPGYRHPVIATVNRSDLEELVGTVPRDILDTVDQGLRRFLRLED